MAGNGALLAHQRARLARAQTDALWEAKARKMADAEYRIEGKWECAGCEGHKERLLTLNDSERRSVCVTETLPSAKTYMRQGSVAPRTHKGIAFGKTPTMIC
jgi:hypothetical protein